MPKKGTPHLIRSPEFKIEVVTKNIRDGVSIPSLAKEYGLSTSLISKWRKMFMEHGPDGFTPKVKGRPKGTPGIGRPKENFGSELERLQYENARLHLEVARLKKIQELQRGNANFQGGQ